MRISKESVFTLATHFVAPIVIVIVTKGFHEFARLFDGRLVLLFGFLRLSLDFAFGRLYLFVLHHVERFDQFRNGILIECGGGLLERFFKKGRGKMNFTVGTQTFRYFARVFQMILHVFQHQRVRCRSSSRS